MAKVDLSKYGFVGTQQDSGGDLGAYGFTQPSQPAPAPAPAPANSFMHMVSATKPGMDPGDAKALQGANSAANFLGMSKFGQGIATTARQATLENDQTGNEAVQGYNDTHAIAAQLHQLIAKHVPQNDPKRVQLVNFLRQTQGQQPISQAEIDPGTTLSNKEVAGSALNTAALFAGGEGAADTAGEGLANGAIQGLKSGARAGLESGALAGAGSELQDNPNATAGSTLGHAVKGGVAGAAIGGITGGVLGAGSSAVKAAARGAKSLIAPATDETTQAAMDAFRTKMTPTEQAEAAAEGRAGTVGANNKITYEPSAQEKKTAEVLKPLVQQGKIKAPVKPGDYFNNVTAVQNEIDNSVKNLRKGLENTGGNWKESDLTKQVLFNTKVPMSIKPNDAMVTNLQSSVLSLVKDTPKTNVGLLDIRQKFDGLVKQEFPNMYEKENAPIRQYIRNLRNSLSDFTEKQLPEGNLPDGTHFRGELKRQSALINAREDMGAKIAQDLPQDSTSFSRWAKANPEKSRVMRRVVLGTAISAAGVYAAGRAINKSLTGK